MWYNGGPVAGDSARVSPIGSICKIFVQSSRLSYGLPFSRKLPFLTKDSYFQFHLTHSPLQFLVAMKILVAHSVPFELPIGSRLSRGKLNKKSGDPVNPIGPAYKTLLLLIFIIKYVIILKKDIKTPQFQLKITKNEVKIAINLSFSI